MVRWQQLKRLENCAQRVDRWLTVKRTLLTLAATSLVATTGFAVALISLMLYVTFHDVFMRRDIFVDMFNSDTEVQAPADPSPAASE